MPELSNSHALSIESYIGPFWNNKILHTDVIKHVGRKGLQYYQSLTGLVFVRYSEVTDNKILKSKQQSIEHYT